MILYILSAILISIALFYSAHSGIKYTRMISNIFMGLKYTPPDEEASVSVGEKISILDSGGHEIEAVLIESKNSNRVVVFCHDSGSTKSSWEKYAYFVPSLGISVLSLDLTMRQKGGEKSSLLQWPTEDEVEHVLVAVRWAKKVWGPDVKIILFGVSKGADLALAASFCDPAVAGVVTDGLFSMKEIFRDYIRRWAPILVKPNLFGDHYPAWVVHIFAQLGFWYSQKQSRKKFVDVEKLLRKKHKPLLLIHGEEDDYISVSHQKFLHRLESKKESSFHLIVPSARHNEAVVVDELRYRESIVEFLKSLEKKS